MPFCQACNDVVSGLVQFIFGWQDLNSRAWKEFCDFKKGKSAAALPAWARFIGDENIAPRGPEMWRQFNPEGDPEDPYSKEEYRVWVQVL